MALTLPAMIGPMDKNLTFAAISLSLVSVLLSAGACLLVTKGVNKAADTGELSTRVVYLERELENMNDAVQALTAEVATLRGKAGPEAAKGDENAP